MLSHQWEKLLAYSQFSASSCLPISVWEIQFPTVPQVVFCICSSISSLSILKSQYSAVDVQANGSSYLLYIFLSTSSRHRHYNMSDMQNQLVISHSCICLHVTISTNTGNHLGHSAISFCINVFIFRRHTNSICYMREHSSSVSTQSCTSLSLALHPSQVLLVNCMGLLMWGKRSDISSPSFPESASKLLILSVCCVSSLTSLNSWSSQLVE